MSQVDAQHTARASGLSSRGRPPITVGERPRVEADLGVAQVVVVEQHQVRLPQTDEFGDVRAGPADVGLDPADAAQHGSAGLIETGVQPDRDPVVPERRVLRGRPTAGRRIGSKVPSASIAKSARSVLTPVVSSHCADQPDRSRPDALLQRAQQIGEFGVAVRVLGEVARVHPTGRLRAPTKATNWTSTEAPLE